MSLPICPYCRKPSKLVTGREVYPFCQKLWGHYFYLCKPCDAYVGVHHGTTKALGVLSNKEHRQAKTKAHDSFDKLWKSKLMTRSDAYRWLSDKMGIPKADTHIGMMTIDQCKEVARVSHAKMIELVSKR